MDSIERLTELFRQFPGIGPRQARRFVYFLLTKDSGYIHNLLTSIDSAKKSIHVCNSCFKFFTSELRDPTDICTICRDISRDTSVRMIVTKDADLEAIEKSHSYHGLYFVLGGTIPILEKNPEQKVRLKELRLIAQNAQKNGVKEIILSMSANAEGENTLDIVRQYLSPFAIEQQFKISTLGRGLSTGTELEYSDGDTISQALKNRA